MPDLTLAFMQWKKATAEAEENPHRLFQLSSYIKQGFSKCR
jgi:hypothetical protein